MDFNEACEATVSRTEARREIARHHADSRCEGKCGKPEHDSAFAAFICDVGDRDSYEGAAVLGWLGY